MNSANRQISRGERDEDYQSPRQGGVDYRSNIRNRRRDLLASRVSAISLDRQIASDAATWLDRQIIADGRLEIRDSGFGREVNKAISRRAQRLVEMGLATAKDGNVRVPVGSVATLERQEVDRVGQMMARERGLDYLPANASEYMSGRLAGVASLVSGRFAIIENGLSFQLVPWHPLLEKRIGQHISGLQRDDGGIEWTFGRNRGLSL
jgi:hypothetical protein